MRFRAALLVSFLVAGCTSVHYESPRLAEQTATRDTVAVLPFEMVFSGKAPKDLTAADIQRIEQAESLAFQASLYDYLLDRSSATRKNPILVRIQPVETTNRLLDERGIGIRESWGMPTESIAETLGVDAVIRTRVHKTRYLSDLASYGTDVGLALLHEATNGDSDWLIPPGLTKTHDISADSEVLNAEDGELLWKVVVHRGTDWRRPANEVVAGITKKLSKKFPYRG
ncbi:MAG: hypothetical protein OES47_12145 [Acidobacteriota bacterium]|nr:hypothetical protein [Acidobacteriota bacterium]